MPNTDRKTALGTAVMHLPLSPVGGFTFFTPMESPSGDRRGIALVGWGPKTGPFGGWMAEADVARALYESGRTM